MKHSTCYAINTNQRGVHPRLWSTFVKHANPYRRPIQAYAKETWSNVLPILTKHPKPIIIDSGCGRGLSSQYLSKKHPDCWIIAIDKSSHRLESIDDKPRDNLIVLRGDSVDYWRLIASSQHLTIVKHYILYPNPWPKKQHVLRRWYAHPLARLMLTLAPTTVIRSNWLLYLQETALVANWHFCAAKLSCLSSTDINMTHFENKYLLKNTPLYELVVYSLC